jgi:hypothetical protein
LETTSPERTVVDTSTNPTTPVRRVLSPDELHRIHTVIRDAADTRQLLGTALGVLYDALSTDAEAEARPVIPSRYAIPASQWQAILTAMTQRAQAWGTAAEVGLELALNLLPAYYDNPAVPAPDLDLPDYRPAEFRITLTRDAVDVIAASEAHLAQLRDFYGPGSEIYQSALHSWHHNLSATLTMNSGSDTHVSKDGALSLFVRTSSGLVYGVIFHGTARYCTSDGCDALIDDGGTARPAHTGAAMRDHEHTPSYPVGAPRPGTWSFHS